MKVVIVCAFDTYFDRVKLLKEYYKKEDVIVISSDFSHRKKKKIHNEMSDLDINVKEYKKNLSIDRLISHYQFSKSVYNELVAIQPDLIHALVPPNSLSKYLSLYKEKYNVKLIFDIIDLWPETLPVGNIKNIFPITLWKNIRDKYLERADIIFTECDLFQEVLRKKGNLKYHTLYWSRKERPLETSYKFSKNKRSFCYLGSINNIIDLDLIVQFLKECNKKIDTTLHIIGNGEEKQTLISRLSAEHITVIDHQEVYSQIEKQKIFDQCDYALNIMKPTVVVGLTMKSLDYMCAGIPLINTIQGDTYKLCAQEEIGHNVNKENIQEIINEIIHEDEEDMSFKREKIKSVYLETFTDTVFFETLDKAGVLHD